MIKLKDKKGFLALPALGFGFFFTLIMGVILIALLIWLSYRIGDIFSPFSTLFDFIRDKWWWFALFIAGLLWHRQIAAVVNWTLGKIGIRV